jgi:hypothetical protein
MSRKIPKASTNKVRSQVVYPISTNHKDEHMTGDKAAKTNDQQEDTQRAAEALNLL